MVRFFREVLAVPVITPEVLARRTREYQAWVEAYARNRDIPIEWAQKGVRKEDYVHPALVRMERANQYGVYFIFKSMEQATTFRSGVPKRPRKNNFARLGRSLTEPIDHSATDRMTVPRPGVL